MNLATIALPIHYNVNRIIESYNVVYDKLLEKKYIYKILDLILTMKDGIRSVVYGIALLCGQENTDKRFN